MNEDYRWNPPFNEIFLWPPASPKSFPLLFGHTPRVSDSVAQLEYSRAFPWILMFVSGREKKIKKEENHPRSSCLIRHFDGGSRYRSVRGPPSGLPSELCRIWALTIGKHISHSFKRNVYRKTNKKKKGREISGRVSSTFLTYSPGRTLEGQSDPGAGWIMGLWLPSSEAQTWSSDITFLGKAKKRLSSSRQGSRLAIYSGLRSWLFLVSRIQFSQFYASSLPK